jgi:hypothetical protein
LPFHGALLSCRLCPATSSAFQNVRVPRRTPLVASPAASVAPSIIRKLLGRGNHEQDTDRELSSRQRSAAAVGRLPEFAAYHAAPATQGAGLVHAPASDVAVAPALADAPAEILPLAPLVQVTASLSVYAGM